MIRKRHPLVADLILNDLTQDRPSHHLSTLVRAHDRLVDVGFRLPSWAALRPGGGSLEDGPGLPRHGWQCEAAEKLEDFLLATSVWPQLPDQDRAMLRSRLMAGLPFTCCPTSPFSFRRSGLSSPSPPSFVAPVASHFAHMPVWPSSRRPWPQQHGHHWQTSLRSALTSDGNACPNAATTDGGEYWELLEGSRCHLLVTASLQRGLVQPSPFQGSAFWAWQKVGQDVGDLLRSGVCQFAHLVTG